MVKLTFVGDAKLLRLGYRQKSFGPLWPHGLAPGETISLPEVPHDRIKGRPEQWLVDGQPYEPPKTEKLAKPKATRKVTDESD